MLQHSDKPQTFCTQNCQCAREVAKQRIRDRDLKIKGLGSGLGCPMSASLQIRQPIEFRLVLNSVLGMSHNHKLMFDLQKAKSIIFDADDEPGPVLEYLTAC